MEENLTFNLNAVFKDILGRMEEEGAYSREVYDDLIDQVLEEKREIGELDTDDDIEEYKEKLKMRWPEAEASFTTGHETDILDQQ